MRFTILGEPRHAVTAIAAAAFAALALLVAPVPDAYEPIRALVASVAAAVVLGIAVAHPRPAGRIDRMAAALLGAYGLSLAVAVAVSGGPSSVYGAHGRFQGLVSTLVCVAVALAGWFASERGIRAAGLALLAAVAASTGLLLWQVLLGAEPVALLGNRVIAGAWFVVAGAMCAAMACVERYPLRAWYGAAAAAAFLAAGASASRGAWIGLGLAAMVLTIAFRRDRRVVLALGAGMALLVAGALVFSAGGASKLDPRSLSGGSAGTRWEIWRGTFDMVADAPLAGVGPGRFIYEFPRYQPFEHAAGEAEDTRPDQAHSLWLHTAAEQGVVSALLLAALVVTSIVAGVRVVRVRDAAGLAAFAGLVAYLGQAMFGVAAIAPDALGWFLAGGLIARAGAVRGVGAEGGAGSRAVAVLGATVSVAAALAAALYLGADARYGIALAAFEQGDFETAFSQAAGASRLAPSVDVYRVAVADAASYGSDRMRAQALAVIDDGLGLEPQSYDLALARARLLSLRGASSNDVADAYGAAVTLYPLGLSVRRETIGALRGAGRDADAEAMRLAVAELERARGQASDVR